MNERKKIKIIISRSTSYENQLAGFNEESHTRCRANLSVNLTHVLL